MAKLPQLLDALAGADTRRERSWFDHLSRAIREDGLLPPSLRGRGAAVLHTRDAANLLVASLAPVTQGEAAVAARQFGSLRRMAAICPEAGPLARVAGADQFEDAVAAGIDLAEDIADALLTWTIRAYPDVLDELRIPRLMPQLRIVIRSTLTANISVTKPSKPGAEDEAMFSADFTMDIHRSDAAEFYAGPFSRKTDTIVTASVGLPTLLRLHDALHGGKGGT